MRSIEDTLSALPGVLHARANLTTRRVRVTWDSAGPPPPVLDALASGGFAATVQDVAPSDGSGDGAELSRHLRALAIAGFAAGNVMMLSMAIWSGADARTGTLFHALSALIALPALGYAGRIFFVPAWRALRHARANMDVPISIGILITAAMSVYETSVGGEAVYFDAALMLVFFLLVGRTLDVRMRFRARAAADAVARFEPRGAEVVQSDGSLRFEPLERLRRGARIRVGPGERLAVDGEIESGRSSVDRSLVSGESVPIEVGPGERLHAGTRNLVAPIVLRATADAEHSFLATLRRMMREAEATKGGYRRIADRAASLYAPLVHASAALSLAGWLVLTGDLHRATSVAVAVLIITCPCALGLAVPIVQVIAARRLFERGVLLKDGVALERLAEVDRVVFDKTGTLTTDRASWTQHVASAARRTLADAGVDGAESAAATAVPSRTLALARALGARSSHPHARALSAESAPHPPVTTFDADDVREIAGAGIEVLAGGHRLRLGRADWARAATRPDGSERPPPASPDSGSSTEDKAHGAASTLVLTLDGATLATFVFHDVPREDARRCLEALSAQGLSAELLSGDAPAPVEALASALGVERWRAARRPADKLARVRRLEADGQRVLMVGDGVNDSPALAAASVSMAPASATDVARRATDFVLLGDRLLGIPDAVSIARRARALVRQNMLLALLYNLCAMPLAIAGLVTPLVAAISMSLSSVLVIGNAMRLTRGHDVAS